MVFRIVVASYVTISRIVSAWSRSARVSSSSPTPGIDDHEVVQPAHQRQRLLDVADEDHLGHLDPGRCEQDVDVGRPAPEHVGEIRFGDPVGRKVEHRWRIARRTEEAAQVPELDAAIDERRLHPEPGRGGAEVEGDRRLADSALRREDDDEAARGSLRGGAAALCTDGDPAHQVVAVERHRQDLVDALVGVDGDRVLGDGQHDDRDAGLGLMELLHELHPTEAALEQGVDHDDVGPVLADPRLDLGPVGDDVDEADLILGVQQAPDVLRDLRHVLDEQQANLISGRHRRNGTTGVWAHRPPPIVRGWAGAKVVRRACEPP